MAILLIFAPLIALGAMWVLVPWALDLLTVDENF